MQITPAWNDIPSGVEVKLTSRIQNEIPDANFLQHVGLDWQILSDQKLVSYQEYKKQVVLQQHGMSLDESGEIVVGVLRDTLPPAAYDLFLKGLEAEIASSEVDIPHCDRFLPLLNLVISLKISNQHIFFLPSSAILSFHLGILSLTAMLIGINCQNCLIWSCSDAYRIA